MEFNERLDHLIDEALQEDIGDGDHSALASIPAETRGKAILKIKQDGVLAGMQVAARIFNRCDAESLFTPLKKDGDTIRAGETAFTIEARAHVILSCERLTLNCMQRMSGIATLTHSYAEKIKDCHAQLLDTRKTTPNFRLLEKEAVRIGGGVNHRFGLFDMIMLKDNHIDYSGGIEKAIQKAYEYIQTKKPGLKIEIETRNINEVKQVVAFGKGKVFRVMLDNFSPAEIQTALGLLDNHFETEASGGITLDNIREYAMTGVDYISVGALIHQARSLDMSLKATGV